MSVANQTYNKITDGIFGVIAGKTRSAVCSIGGFFFLKRDENVWLFPPCELAAIIAKHIANLHKACLFTGAILLSSRSAKYLSRYLTKAVVLQTWVPGADLFREVSGDQWHSLPPIGGEYIVYGFGLQ